MLRRVLFPLDGSKAAERALRFTRILQRAFDCDVVLLRVVDAVRGPGKDLADSIEWRFCEMEARAYLASVLQHLEEDVRAETQIVSGQPAWEILRVAASVDADLIVMTESGEGGGGVCGSGSTAHQVLSAAETSILIVRGPADAGAEEEIRRIVAPVDGSTRGDWTLSLAARLAEAAGVELTLLHVVQQPLTSAVHGRMAEAVPAGQGIDLQREHGEVLLEERRRRLAALSVLVRSVVVVEPSVSRTIATMAAEGPPCLLVLSAHGQSAASGWPYGSVVSSLLAYGRVSTLVFQDLPGRGRHKVRSRGWAAARRRTFSRPPA